MGGVKFEWVTEPRGELVVDRAAVLGAMGATAIALLRARLPAVTGELAESVRAWFVGGELEVGPEGERNQIKVKMAARRGHDLFAFTDDEQRLINEAAQEEVDRQVAAHTMRLEV